jgi:hypothetical protein
MHGEKPVNKIRILNRKNLEPFSAGATTLSSALARLRQPPAPSVRAASRAPAHPPHRRPPKNN